MPKPLDKPQPSSSVANMLDLGVGAAALAKPSRRENVPPTPVANELPPQPATPPTEPPGEPANIHRQFILTRSADETMKKLVRIYSRAGGVGLKRRLTADCHHVDVPTLFKRNPMPSSFTNVPRPLIQSQFQVKKHFSQSL